MKDKIKKLKDKIGTSELSRKIIKNTGWMVAQNVYTMIIGVFVTGVVARYYGTTGYGIVNYALAFTGLFSGLATFGTNHIIIKDLTQNHEKKEKVLGTILTIRTIFAIVVLLVSQVALFFISKGDKTTMVIALLFNFKTIASVFDVISYYANSKIKNKYISILKIISITVFSILKVLCVVFKLNLVLFAATYLIEGIIYAILLICSMKKISGEEKVGKWYFDRKYAKEVLKRSYPYALASIMVTIYLKIDQVMLGSIMGDKSQVGIYSAAVRIAEMWTFVPLAVIASFKPVIISYKETNEEKYKLNLQRLYNIISLLCFAFALFMLFAGNIVIYILYGTEFASANIPMYILLWGIWFGNLGNVHYIWMICEEKQKYSLFYSFSGCITNIIFNIILIPRFGMIGAAIATLISQISSNIISFALIKETRILSKMLLKSLNPINGIKDLLSQKK